MKSFHLFQSSHNPWTSGLRLALLNAILAAFCIVSFIGVLYIVSRINQLRLANDSTLTELPFPYPVLMLLYVMMFLIAWIWFGRHLSGVWREKTITTLAASR